ncbi:MAG: hypothetical protein K9H26_14100 [Prolixibacteraceae bacterium]|nr:hypothetical protein [Prolixibacteraceae bacterium]
MYKFPTLLFVLSGLIFTSCSQAPEKKGFENFITVKGNKLMDGEKEFRFVSYNVPTLNFNEDEFAFDRLHPYSLPDEFELRDVFETISQMGGKVVRMYTLPVKFGFEPDDAPAYITGPGQFSEEAFKTMDMALAIANEYNIRVIFPLLNNWQWMGGRPQYAAFRGKTINDFWTDRQLIDDFKATINFTLNRVNTITGIPYKEDKAILCWETGNELTSPIEWTVEICRYLKELDPNHLVMDGYHAIDSHPIREASIVEPSIDIIHSHHYEVNPAEFIKNVDRNIAIMNKRKPYIIGEFGFVSTPAIEQYINKIIDTEICGMLIWGLRGHRSEGGFYWHSEPLGYGRYKSYHWPGFDSGEAYDERNLMRLLREKAYEINGEKAPALPAPKKPELLPFDHVWDISWRGSAGASHYDLFRAKSEAGPWKIIGYNIDDASSQYFPLFNDATAQTGETYYYRIVAKSSVGKSEPSNIIGPISVNNMALVDNMNNFSKLYFCSEGITLETNDDRKFKEDMFRLKGNKGNEITYLANGAISGFKLYSYAQTDTSNLAFGVSEDNVNFVDVVAKRESYNNGKGDYGYWVPIFWKFSSDGNYKYLKIKFEAESQLSRLELYYKPLNNK